MSNRRVIFAIMLLAALLVVAAGYGWWFKDLRWRPHVLSQHGPEIASLVEGAGWVSPHVGTGKAIYLVSFRACPDCIRFEKEQFPRLQAAGVDTRVVMFPVRGDSTPAERATVAELWANRDWKTFQRWTAVTPAAWTAQGIPSADADPVRAALVEKSQTLVDQLRPLLAENGIAFGTPILIWRDVRGHIRGCVCTRRETYDHIRQQLGV